MGDDVGVGIQSTKGAPESWRSSRDIWGVLSGAAIVVLLFASRGTTWMFSLVLLVGAGWNAVTWDWGTSGRGWLRVWRKYVVTGLILVAAAMFGGLEAAEVVWG